MHLNEHTFTEKSQKQNRSGFINGIIKKICNPKTSDFFFFYLKVELKQISKWLVVKGQNAFKPRQLSLSLRKLAIARIVLALWGVFDVWKRSWMS